MIMKQGFVRGAVSGGLLGLLAGVAAEDMAVKINNFNFAPQRIPVKAEPPSPGRTRTTFHTPSLRPPRR
jgi:hypothetical protein